MLGVWFSDIDKKIRIRNNNGQQVLLIVTDESGKVYEELIVTDPESIKRFDVFRGYMLSLNYQEGTTSQEKFDDIINNFKKTFDL